MPPQIFNGYVIGVLKVIPFSSVTKMKESEHFG